MNEATPIGQSEIRLCNDCVDTECADLKKKIIQNNNLKKIQVYIYEQLEKNAFCLKSVSSWIQFESFTFLFLNGIYIYIYVIFL